jgi:hypothetical protein
MPKTQVNIRRIPRAWLLGAAFCAACAPIGDDVFHWESMIAAPSGGAGGPALKPIDAGVGNMSSAGAGAAAPAGGATAGNAGSIGPAGTGGVSAALDPNVTFEWTGTASDGDACKPANFAGNFTCTLTPTLAPVELEGSITLSFTGASEAQMLTLSSGQLTAFDQSAMIVQAGLNGQLDCSSHDTNITVAPTMTQVLSLDRLVIWGFLNEQPTVSGTVHGTFDPHMLTINGDVTLTVEPMSTCIGTFSLRASP